MTTVEDNERAIRKRAPAELDSFRTAFWWQDRTRWAGLQTGSNGGWSARWSPRRPCRRVMRHFANR